MPQSGRWSPPLTIAAMFALAVLAASGSAWFRMRSSQQAVAFFGSEASQLILTAPRATAQPPQADREPIDISTAPGFMHLRRSLLSDRSYDWRAAPVEQVDPADGEVWTLKFTDGQKQATIGLDLPHEVLTLEPSRKSMSFAPAAEAYRKFFAALVESER